MVSSPQSLFFIFGLLVAGITMLAIHKNYPDDKKKQLLTAGIICTVIGIGWGGLYILFHGFGTR
jgi:hypothetical protein